ncbi:hypothetical protein CSQ86_01545 [Bifidobacterium felsineum]|uniref:Asp-tRNAAsn/Glu-tRNAGln amidotransferase A subunit n=2 Tax=Bifidobacterium felsineum TaxID=2045440 RepID=A0A2M9HLS3_9BIFI|nr:hypothetical protein [Bifidobacterium felsineum]PJM77774.1 hypothetical protein CSQ86_01545 [Bifidobacterium felsineum]
MSAQEQTMSPDQDVVDPLKINAEESESEINDSGENKDGEPKRAARPTRHAMIMRGIVTPIFGLLAVASVVLGVLNATIWKPSAEITATSTITGSRYIVTDPGVLPLLDRNVTLSVDSVSSSNEVCVALGSSKDVAGWVASESSYTRISGLASWTSLATQTGKATGQVEATSSENAVEFKDSDMWSSVKCGKGDVSLTSAKTTDSTMAIIDLGKGAASTGAQVSMHWVRSQVPDFAMPFYLSGGLLAVIAVLCASVFAMPPHKRRKRVVEGKATIHTDLSFAERAEQGLVGARLPESVPARKHRRHAAHRRGAAVEAEREINEPSEQVGTPVIVDPASRNLVADQQAAAGESAAGILLGGKDSAAESSSAAPSVTGSAESGEFAVSAKPTDEEATSVITSDELAAYFARLAQEVQQSNEAAGDVSEHGQTNENEQEEGNR